MLFCHAQDIKSKSLLLLLMVVGQTMLKRSNNSGYKKGRSPRCTHHKSFYNPTHPSYGFSANNHFIYQHWALFRLKVVSLSYYSFMIWVYICSLLGVRCLISLCMVFLIVNWEEKMRNQTRLKLFWTVIIVSYLKTMLNHFNLQHKPVNSRACAFSLSTFINLQFAKKKKKKEKMSGTK